MVVVVENSTSGGRAAAPIVHRVLSAAFGVPPLPDIVPLDNNDLPPRAMRPLFDDGPVGEEEETEWEVGE